MADDHAEDDAVTMRPAILETLTLADRTGAAVTPATVYGRRRSAETEEDVAALVGYQRANEVFDIAWSSSLATAMPSVATATKDSRAYRVESWERVDQRTIRVWLAAAL